MQNKMGYGQRPQYGAKPLGMAPQGGGFRGGDLYTPQPRGGLQLDTSQAPYDQGSQNAAMQGGGMADPNAGGPGSMSSQQQPMAPNGSGFVPNFMPQVPPQQMLGPNGQPTTSGGMWSQAGAPGSGGFNPPVLGPDGLPVNQQNLYNKALWK
jgi:hypothetical protein